MEIKHSYGVVGDDKIHDSAFALYAISKVEKDMQLRTESQNFEIITIVPDAAASHLKNRYQFHELQNHSCLQAVVIYSDWSREETL